MVKEIKKLKSDSKVYSNIQLTNAIKNLITMLEYTNGILANHQAMLEGICKITGITIEDIKKELENNFLANTIELQRDNLPDVKYVITQDYNEQIHLPNSQPH